MGNCNCCNCWTGISHKKLEKTEKLILAYSGIPIEEFDIKDVVIDDEDNFVRTF
jgi:hypothetical protein